MELSNADKLLLLLYLAYFKKEYDINDNRIINVGNNKFLKRHIEVQNIGYLTEAQDVHIGCFYDYIWNNICPFSNALTYDLNELDKTPDKIAAFYQEFNDKKYGSFNDKLLIFLNRILLRDYRAEQVVFSSFVLEDIMNIQNGNIIMAGMIYLRKTVFPTADIDHIFEKLETRLNHYGIDVDKKDEELAWRSALITGLIPINRQYLYNKPKELKRLLRP